MSALIYALIDPISREVRYVGKTVDIRGRFMRHLTDLKSNRRKSEWITALRALSLKPEIKIIETDEDGPGYGWPEAERFWIAFFKSAGANLYNLDNGGCHGALRSQETKDKIRIGNLGKKRSLEYRQMMSRRMKGKPMSPNARRALLSSHLGKSPSAESRAKMSKSQQGRKHSSETKRKMSEWQIGIAKPPMPQATRDKLRAAMLGRYVSPATREKMRRNGINRTHSEATKRKISESKKGKKMHPNTLARLVTFNTGRKRTFSAAHCEAIKQSWLRRRLTGAETIETPKEEEIK